MKTLTILLLPFIMISCSKLEEITPTYPEPTHYEIHVFAKESICTLSINDTTMYLGNTSRQEVYLFKVKELNYLNFMSYGGCALTITEGRYKTEYGFIYDFTYRKRGG